MNLSGWGNFPRIESTRFFFETRKELAAHLAIPVTTVAYGLGRSYGDAALNRNVICTTRFDKLLDFDADTGVVTCESGVTLADLVETFLPAGWFLPVTPGTRFITVGGAIASDVHGKNHHVAGCFSEFVSALDLILPGGDVLTCSRDENSELFHATCGGMGLTGVILSAHIRLMAVKSACIDTATIVCRNLEESLNAFEEHRQATYSVAWIDCLARGRQLGRSILFTGEHATGGGLAPAPPGSRPMPSLFPGAALNRFSMTLFNRLYFQHNCRQEGRRRVSLYPFFYPLDAIDGWNRMYGRQGFLQYQCVLPKETAAEGFHLLLDRIARSGLGSFLSVLKLFGPENGNLLSFPMEGYTLALDFKRCRALFPLLEELDHMVAARGGRLYLAKDARMSRAVFESGYPRLGQFRELRRHLGLGGKFSSLQSNRLEV